MAARGVGDQPTPLNGCLSNLSTISTLQGVTMSTHELSGTTALVTGASRGFGRGVASAMSAAGARVIGVARDHDRLAALKSELGESFVPVVADATDPSVAG